MCSLFSLSFRLTPVTEPRTNIDIEATTHSRVDGLDQFCLVTTTYLLTGTAYRVVASA